ncbi:hypothetical protein [Methyloglobulus sp.]|uniref:hypothetical protein n=1 Tax=Methyloglobulus sp. TaxID=2518622 RepID=UPI0032B82392
MKKDKSTINVTSILKLLGVFFAILIGVFLVSMIYDKVSQRNAVELAELEQGIGSAGITSTGLAINPNSFTGDKTSGNTISFDIIQQNIDKINLTYELLGTDLASFETRVAPLSQSNSFTFPIPKDFIGQLKMTAFGYSNNRLIGQNVHIINIQAPTNLTLQSIRYEDPDVEISEQQSLRFKLLGTYSDGIERRINDIVASGYVIDDPAIIRRTGQDTVEGLSQQGETTLTATVGTLTATLNVFVKINQERLVQKCIVAAYQYQAKGKDINPEVWCADVTSAEEEECREVSLAAKLRGEIESVNVKESCKR